MSASILVVDDEPVLVENVQLALEADGYRVLTAKDGYEALEVMQAHPVDLILADIAMPRMNGYEFYKRVRDNADWVLIPFVFLTARTLDSDIIYGKELGVDDYLLKPIRARELLAVIRGKLRRLEQLSASAGRPHQPMSDSVLVAGPLRIDASRHEVYLEDKLVKLSPKEFTLLEYLARQPNQVLSPQAIIKVTHSLETDQNEASNLIRPLILSLRRKLDADGLIDNVRGVGYCLRVEE